MKGLRFLLLGLAICLASGMKAQIYNSDVLFYVESDSRLTNPQTRVIIFRFRNGNRQTFEGSEKTLKAVCDNLKRDMDYYETLYSQWKTDNWGSYDSNMSNLKWHVFSKKYSRLYIDGLGLEWPDHIHYIAFKKDFSQYMYWSEPEYDDWRGDHNGTRVTHNRLTKSDILKLSFTGARDFLQ